MIMNLAGLGLGFLGGLIGWTFLEYVIHYWLGHLPRGKTMVSSEHIKHHKDILYFSSLALKIRGAVPVLAITFAGVWAAAGAR